MWATVSRSEFERLIRWQTTGCAAIQSVLFTCRDDQLVIEVSNAHCWKQSHLDLCDDRGEEGSVMLPSARIVDLVRVAKADTVAISHPDSSGPVTVSCGRSRVTMQPTAASDGWWTPEKPNKIAEVDAEDLGWALRAVRSSAAEARAGGPEMLKAINVNISEGQVVLTGTNTYRVSQVLLGCMSSSTAVYNVDAAPLVGALAVMDDLVYFTDSDGMPGLTDDNSTLVTRVYYGDYPDLAAAMRRAAKAQSAFRVDTEEFSAATRLACGDAQHGQIDLTVGEEQVTVSSRSADGAPSNVETTLPAELHNLEEGFLVTVSGAYIGGLVKTIRTGTVEIRVSEDPKIPLTLVEVDEPTQGVIMNLLTPVRRTS